VWRLSDDGLLTCEAAGNREREGARCLTVQRNGKLVLTLDGHSKAKCQRWRLVRCVSLEQPTHPNLQRQNTHSHCASSGSAARDGEDSSDPARRCLFFPAAG
jgi:hypothetical protein